MTEQEFFKQALIGQFAGRWRELYPLFTKHSYIIDCHSPFHHKALRDFNYEGFKIHKDEYIRVSPGRIKKVDQVYNGEDTPHILIVDDIEVSKMLQ